MAVNHALGSLSGPWYFINSKGHIQLPFSEEDARQKESELRRRGYQLCQVSTLREWDRLEKTLIDQEERELQSSLQRDERACAAGRERVRQALYARAVSSSTSEFEKEFIRLYMQLREDKRAKFRQRWLERQSYFEALHYDAGHPRALDVVDKVPDSGK